LRHQVDEVLELVGNAEVPERHCEHERIGCKETLSDLAEDLRGRVPETEFRVARPRGPRKALRAAASTRRSFPWRESVW